MTPPAGSPHAPAPVCFTDAAIGYGARPVVRGLNLRIEAGERVALLGPNGSGKSTVVRGLLGLARLLDGSLELFGVRADRFHERARIGYVPQRNMENSPVPATVWEVVTTGRLARRGLFTPLRRHDRLICAQAIATVGLADRRTVQVAHLSGGQQRRVLIARALAGEPDLLVMDEPTAGVDVEQQQALLNSLHRLAAGQVTMVVVTHDLAGLDGLVDRSVTLEHGRLVRDQRLVPEPHPQAPAQARAPQQPAGLRNEEA